MEKTMSEENKNTQGVNENTENASAGESNAARRIRLMGIEVEEKHDEPIAKTGFFENFWYHYKGLVIAAAFVVLIVAVGVFQMAAKSSPDIYVMYSGPSYFDNTSALMSAFTSVMPDDYNGDGEKSVSVLQTVTYTKEQIALLEEEADRLAAEAEDGAGFEFRFDYTFNAQEYERFQNEIMVGESVICLIDPALYSEVKGEDLLLTVEEVLGYTPSYAHDEFAIKFKETEFAKYYNIFDSLPDDTLLIIRRVTAMTNIKGKAALKRHEDHVDFYKAMIEFVPAE